MNSFSVENHYSDIHNTDVLLSFAALKCLGITLEIHEGKLRYLGPAQHLSLPVIEFLRTHKQSFVEIISQNVVPRIVFRATRVQQRYLKQGLNSTNVNNCVHVRGNISADKSTFTRDLLYVCQRNPIFGAVFFERFSQIFFYFPDRFEMELEWVEPVAAETPDSAACRPLADSLFSPSKGYLSSMRVLRYPGELDITFCVHHCVSDGTSIMNFLGQLLDRLAGKELECRLTQQIKVLGTVAEEEDLICQAISDQALAQIIDNDFRPPCPSSFCFSEESVPSNIRTKVGIIPYDLCKLLVLYSRARSVTPFVVMLALYGRAIEEFYPQWNGVVSFPVTMRDADSDCPGPRVNNLLVSLSSWTGELSELVSTVNTKMNAVRTFEAVPIEHLIKQAREAPEGLFHVRLNYLKFPFVSASHRSNENLSFDILPAPGNFLFKLYLWDEPAGGLRMRFVYRTEFFSSKVVDGIAAAFDKQIRELITV